MHVTTWGFRHLVPRSWSGTRPSRRRLAALLAVGLVAGACSSGGDDADPQGARATFDRADGAALEFEDPVTTVADLLPPEDSKDAWMIAGSVFDPKSSTSVATTWVSGDGEDWKRKDVSPASRDASESFSALARTKDGTVAVGWVGDGEASDAAVWRQDGDDWSRIGEGDALGGTHEQWAFDVAASDAGILVAGGESAWGDVRPRLWFSPDGKTFTSVDGGPGGPLDATGQESVSEVAAIGDGFVAVGSRTVNNNLDGAVWFSPDGTSWEQIEAPTLGGDGRQAVLSLANAGDVLVAGGYRGQGSPVVWRSEDGRSWSAASAMPVPDSGREGSTVQAVRSITVDDEGLVAAGGANWRPQVWRSTDAGKSWAQLPDPMSHDLYEDGVTLDSAAYVGGTTVALGLEPSVMRLTPGSDRWKDVTSDSFPDGGVQPFATSIAEDGKVKVMAGGRYSSPRATTRERYIGQVWTDGDDGWSPLDTDRLQDGQIFDLAHYDGGFVAVGFEDRSVAASRSAGDDTSPDGLLWTSPDGKKWTRIAAQSPRVSDDVLAGLAASDRTPEELAAAVAAEEARQPRQSLAPIGGEGTRSLEAVAPFGKGFIAVGVSCCTDPGEPIVVVSRDGKAIAEEPTGLGGAGTQRFRDVCVGPDDTAIAVGITGSDGNYDAAVRVRTPNQGWSGGTAADKSFTGAGSQQFFGCAASEDGFVAVGSDDRTGDDDARVWTSKDGKSWARVDSSLFGGAGDQTARAVDAVPDGGWLVGGGDTAPGDGDIALWRVDGDDVTRRDEDEPELSGPGEQSVTNLMVDDDGVTIVGDDFGRVGVWQSDTVDR